MVKIKAAFMVCVCCILMACERSKNIMPASTRMVIKDTIVQNMNLVFVPAGCFKFGYEAKQDTISYNYYMGKYEVTNKQFYQFLTEALKSNFLILKDQKIYWHYEGDSFVAPNLYQVKVWDDRISLRNDSIYIDTAYTNHPVTAVTWFGCMAYCKYYGFALPTIKEWEKAARGNFAYRFPWGNNIDSSYANYYNSRDPFEPETTPVGFYNGQKHGTFQTSYAASAYGCYDMAGNAWEWTIDRWGKGTPYGKGKGGGYHYHTPAFMQVYYVSTFGPHQPPPLDMCDRTDGFRVVYKYRK